MGIYVGTASWSIPKAYAAAFPAAGSHLERYAQVLSGVEINTSFYRPHQPKTYARWAASTLAGFRFALKAPRTITHERKLVGCEELLFAFLAESAGLGEKRGPLLFQLPPGLAYDERAVRAFLAVLRTHHPGPVVFEPRHPSWFQRGPEQVLAAHGVARAAADPARVPAAAEPGGDPALLYFRWHGSPEMYKSAYGPERVAALAREVTRRADATEAWVVFDNTTFGHATGDALGLLGCLAGALAS